VTDNAVNPTEPTTIPVWYIVCSTGCTCCAYENFDQGFYKVREDAGDQVQKWLQGEDNPLASQYARYGRYRVVETQAEILPDGRWIVDGRVYAEDYFGKLDD
jgi:hypothetical protein